MEKKNKGGGTKTWSTKRLNALIQEIIDWHLKEGNEQCFGVLNFFEGNKDKYNYTDTNFYHRLKDYGDEESQMLMNQLNTLLEMRMIKFALTQQWSSNMAKFLLNCKFDYVPKTQQDINVKSDNLKFEFDGDDTPAE